MAGRMMFWCNDSASDDGGQGVPQAREGSRKKIRFVPNSTINPDLLEAAAITIGFPTSTSRPSHKPVGRGCGLTHHRALKNPGLPPGKSILASVVPDTTSQLLPRTSLSSPPPDNTPTHDFLDTVITSESTTSPQPSPTRITRLSSKSTMTFFTYRVQLTFGLSSVCREVNVTTLFLQWFEQSRSLLANFSLLPFEDERGLQITSSTQIPEDGKFFRDYYHNHRVLQHGNLTGMVHF
jgi:hypothetical protein